MDCRLCAQVEAGDEFWGDDLWSLASLGDAPGWTMLTLRRHAVGIWELTADEVASLGPTLNRVSQAIRSAAGTEKVYIHHIAEGQPHFHLVLLPRGADVADEHRGPNLFTNRAAYGGQPDETARVAGAIGRELGG